MSKVALTTYSNNCVMVKVGRLNLFFSYSTLVAVHCAELNYRARTEENYSRTTARHLSKMGCKDWPKVPQSELEDIVS